MLHSAEAGGPSDPPLLQQGHPEHSAQPYIQVGLKTSNKETPQPLGPRAGHQHSTGMLPAGQGELQFVPSAWRNGDSGGSHPWP